jgi:predicted nucleotidyltransferase component of viral defense system
MILGSLDGIETGIRQLIRDQPLETVRMQFEGQELTVPTLAEILRIKGVLILKRNATRDYLDFVALADAMKDVAVVEALQHFDEIYPQLNGQSALQQLQIQLAKPLPYDLEDTRLNEYKDLIPRWHDWSNVEAAAARVAELLLEHL